MVAERQPISSEGGAYAKQSQRSHRAAQSSAAEEARACPHLLRQPPSCRRCSSRRHGAWKCGMSFVWYELRLSSPRRALTTDYPEQIASAALSALLETRRDERVVLQWLIGPWLVRRIVPPASKAQRDGGLFELTQVALDSEETKALRDK